MLPAIAETVAQALKLPYAAIALRHGERIEVVTSYGLPRGEPAPFPLVYQGEAIGDLLVTPRSASEQFTAAERALLTDVARHAGVAAHAVQLTAALKRSRERLVTAREEERRRLRRDLHDGLGPALASLTLRLDAARNLAARDPAAAAALLSEMKATTQDAITDIRRLVYELRPPALDELGLVAAIERQASQYAENGLRLHVEGPAVLPALPAAVEVAAFRIAQEALTNVARHARARSCRVALSVDGSLRVEITDDGTGLPPDRPVGVGLTSMRERAEELGGTLVVERLATGGTRVLAELPLERE